MTAFTLTVTVTSDVDGHTDTQSAQFDVNGAAVPAKRGFLRRLFRR